MGSRLHNLQDCLTLLQGLGADVVVEGEALRFPTLWGPHCPAWIAWRPSDGLVLISQTLPEVAEAKRERMAVALHQVHLELAVLGFVLNQRTGALDFRTHMMLDAYGAVSGDLLLRVFRYVVDTCERRGTTLGLDGPKDPPWWAEDE